MLPHKSVFYDRYTDKEGIKPNIVFVYNIIWPSTLVRRVTDVFGFALGARLGGRI
jgi:hypothetical protein